MRSLRPASALLVVLTLVTPLAGGSLRGQIDAALNRANLGEASVAVSVIEAGSGDTLIDVNAGTLMSPASNMKLVTTGAALHMLGADFRFETKLLHAGDKLIVLGAGDPAFGDPDLLVRMRVPGREDVPMDVREFVKLWTDAVLEQGYTRIDEIIVDDSVFDREYVHPTWPRDQLNRQYCAEVSGLVFHLNRVHYFPEPQPGSRPSLVNFVPRFPSLTIRNSGTSLTGPHDDDTAWIARKLDTNDTSFYGNVKHIYRTPVPVTTHETPRLFGDLLAANLRRAGLDVGPARVSDPTEEMEWVGDVVGPVIFTPIATIITRCNRDSQNLYAECLIKRMGGALTGQPGSWLNGAAIVRHAVHERLDSANLSSKLLVADGSGLSRSNRIAAATLTAWLDSFHDDETLGPMFIESLAVGGTNGTLRNRFHTQDLAGAVVHAKSGYINGVSCLSGYITDPAGRRRCFSIMVNDLTVPVRRAKAMQDEVVALIARDMATVPAPATVQMGSD